MTLRCDYSSALRCIGQALEKQDIEVFDLKCDDHGFSLECGDTTAPYLTLIELRYSFDDIESLDREGKAKRGGSFKMVDFNGLPEILRAVGRYIDNKNADLMRISNSEWSNTKDSLQLEYETRDGHRRMEDFSMASIYDIMVRMYKDRA